ncbi:hypothetical protein B0T24DRAFT_590263 [Lasiosphaeria ovina]|uniref:DUF4211 domain-containing protein n=1 Tax=Lasiosphaeria ovina TaxID=92902 RepID=A0AAE0NDW7_9PEZI|nr:hypothetical protein B0T24DRAFT_590263 [Lasiosphaeria ovina]
MPRLRKPKQQTLEATLGQPRVRAPVKTSKTKSPQKSGSSPSWQQSSGSKRQRVVQFLSVSSDENGDGKGGASGEDLDEDVDLPTRKRTRSSGPSPRRQPVSLRSPPKKGGPVSSSQSRRRARVADSDDDDDNDDDDEPLVTPISSSRSSRKRAIVLDDSDEDEEQQQRLVSSPIKRRRLIQKKASSPPSAAIGAGDPEDENDTTPRKLASSSAAPSRRTPRKPRTEKEKARERLRRKRAGETIEELSSESSDPETKKPIYDTDSDNPALASFDDDDEGVIQYGKAEAAQDSSKKSKKKDKKGKAKLSLSSESDNAAASDGEGSGSDKSIENFVVEDDETPMGVPADLLVDMPLQFTAHSHKPMKEHFRDALEWLVLRNINPGFEKDHELYKMAWKKLDDEVRGLAQSKFASSAWKKDFLMALRARPELTNAELHGGDAHEFQNCGACGRSNHPAKWVMSFSGPPYYKEANEEYFLEDVDVDSSDSSSSHRDDEEEEEDVDEDGNRIPEEAKRWFIGSVCNSNAVTAHNLIHWKHALMDWVDATLEGDGYMLPGQLQKRAKMKPRKLYKTADKILKAWAERGLISDLYREFKNNIENARNKTTSGRWQR